MTCWASPRNFPKPLCKALARFPDENKQLAFRDPHYLNTLLRCLDGQTTGGVFTRHEERLGQLLLMALRIFQQAAELGSGGLCSSCRNELRAKNEAARRVYQCDAIEIPIKFRPDGRMVEAERNPSLVDLEVFGVKHATTVLVTP